MPRRKITGSSGSAQVIMLAYVLATTRINQQFIKVVAQRSSLNTSRLNNNIHKHDEVLKMPCRKILYTLASGICCRT